jgi:hypothetical protein
MGKWTGKFGQDLDQVWRLLKIGIDLPLNSHHPLEQELRTLAAPHLAVLIHKRAKLVAEAEEILSGRWLAELVEFAERIGRFVAEEWQSDQRRIVGLLDDIIAEEQYRLDEMLSRDEVPVTGRFDMRWAN